MINRVNQYGQGEMHRPEEKIVFVMYTIIRIDDNSVRYFNNEPDST